MNVLSISSHVSYGHVGNSATVFALQRLGIETWPIHTVRFSNHPGHGRHRGRLTNAAEIAEIIAGLDDIGALQQCDAILSGYLGGADVGAAVRDSVDIIKARNPRAIYVCDPVMGDSASGFYVREDIRRQMGACAAAVDIVVPNAFELEFLTDRPSQTVEEAKVAAERLRDLGPEMVVVTSIASGSESVSTMVVTGRGATLVTTPRIELGRRPDGAGDLFAALFLGRYLEDRNPARALAAATSSVFGVIEAARAGGHRELPLVSAQSELVQPSRVFEAVALR